MRLPSILLAASLFISTLAISNLHASEPLPVGLSVSISFTPASTNPDAFTCNAEVADLATGVILAKPKIIGLKGESNKAQIGDDKSLLVLDVLVNKAGTNGTYTVTYSKSGRIVGVQKGSISLQ
jgi:hypothetical protein